MRRHLMSDARVSLAEQLVERLLEAIAAGDYPPGGTLPPEGELADMAGVSRLTVREAVKSLQAKGVVRIHRGRGTFVNPTSEWSPLDPKLLAARSHEDGKALSRALLETRRLVEESVAELAATRRTDEDVAALQEALNGMRTAAREDDIGRFVAADIAFHQVLMDAARNPVLGALFQPIGDLILQGRWETSKAATARQHALRAHGRILKSFAAGDPQATREAMRRHLTETAADLERLTANQAAPSAPSP